METVGFKAILSSLLTVKVSICNFVFHLHFDNLDRLPFHPIAMEEHISAMLHPGMWDLTLKSWPQQPATMLLCTTPATVLRNGIIGSDVSLYFNTGVIVITLTFLEVHQKIFHNFSTSNWPILLTATVAA